MFKKELAKHIDLANHHPEATSKDIKELCRNVLKFGFNSAFVNQHYVKLARQLLKKKGKVGTVISFPLGQDTIEAKLFAVKQCIKDGADELDVSMNIGLFKEKKYDQSLKEMQKIVKLAKSLKKDVIVKIIIETGYLEPEEIIKASQLVMKAKGDFVKTCSGLGPRGAWLSDVFYIKRALGKNLNKNI